MPGQASITMSALEDGNKRHSIEGHKCKQSVLAVVSWDITPFVPYLNCIGSLHRETW